MTTKQIQKRLEYLRQEIRAERISWGELAELQSLAQHITKDDVELLEWAGVKEGDQAKAASDDSFEDQEMRLAAIARDVADENAPEIY